MAYCEKCGAPIEAGEAFCANCGTKVGTKGPKANRRSIPLSIILSFLTCGIYGLYWLAKVNDEINALAETNGESGAMVVLFSLLTCGVYEIYWIYKMGEKANKISDNPEKSFKLLLVILTVFRAGFVGLAILQDVINEKVSE